MASTEKVDLKALKASIVQWAQELGFSDIGVSDVDLSQHQQALERWLKNQYHGNMDYMNRNIEMRVQPDALLPGTLRVISVRMDYLPTNAKFAQLLKQPDHAYISRYALGRDYHKLMRNRLKQLGEKIKQHCHQLNFRPFVDSAPILERPLAEKAGLGWVGKHSLLLNKQAGSWFFLGELLVDIELPIDQQTPNHCGDCVACMKICPTNAIVEPYVVDARRCISYLTIELRESIPLELRNLIGNRIYGCDDCQLICPWNRFAKLSVEADFQARNAFDEPPLLALFAWTEDEFLKRTQGSPIRRIGYACWQRNIATAMGNAPFNADIVKALMQQHGKVNDMVDEHIDWALEQQRLKQQQSMNNQNERLTARLIRSIEKGLSRDA
ncbi:tRNA epoxyqueuosine(34) reductase QueG [Thalassotalea aquiviva]|uniref:tRNA epoxyqueuosine(34) reductase QueG n=1 Tax=Thalassotalea aquiviva TaxID=3242415 RepID=UPI00352A007F